MKTRSNRKWIVNTAKAAIVAAALVACGSSKAEQTADTKYAGVNNCKMCHSDKHEAWKETGHSRAYEQLLAVGKQGAAECVGCHTTGNGKEGGFKDEKTTPEMVGVQCESCHGPGKEHNGNTENITKTPSALVCAGCHLERNIH